MSEPQTLQIAIDAYKFKSNLFMRQEITERFLVFNYIIKNRLVADLSAQDTIRRIEATLIEWPKLERLSALIYHAVMKQNHLHFFSQKYQSRLKLNTFSLIADVELKKRAIQQLNTLLKDSKTNLLLLKGMAFNELIYKSESPRGTSDIDLLIDQNSMDYFKQEFGAIATKVEQSTSDAFDGLFEETWHSRTYKRVFYDIHWHLSYPSLFDFDQKEMFKRSTVHPFYNGQNVRVLSSEDHLVYLAIHMMKDCDFYDYGLLDCHELISQQEPDLAVSFAIAKKWGAATSLFYVLTLSKEHMQSPICAKLLNNHQPNIVKHKLCKLVIKKLFPVPTKIKSKLHRVKQLVAVLLFTDNFIRVLKHYTFYLGRHFRA